MKGYLKGAILLICVLALPAWASSGSKVTDNEVSQVELAIRSAENATATQHARDLLDRARAALSSAQNERAKGRHDRSRGLLAEAQAAAVAAESKAKATRLEEEAAAVKRQTDELEGRIRAFNEPARRS